MADLEQEAQTVVIKLTLETSRMSLIAGGVDVEQQITLLNQSSLSDIFELSLEDLPAQWGNFSNPRLNLFPGWSETVSLNLKVPQTVEPGLYQGKVVVASTGQAEQYRSFALLQVEVLPDPHQAVAAAEEVDAPATITNTYQNSQSEPEREFLSGPPSEEEYAQLLSDLGPSYRQFLATPPPPDPPEYPHTNGWTNPAQPILPAPQPNLNGYAYPTSRSYPAQIAPAYQPDPFNPPAPPPTLHPAQFWAETPNPLISDSSEAITTPPSTLPLEPEPEPGLQGPPPSVHPAQLWAETPNPVIADSYEAITMPPPTFLPEQEPEPTFTLSSSLVPPDPPPALPELAYQSAELELHLETNRVSLAAGIEVAEQQVRLTNLSDATGSFSLTVEDIPEEWYTLSARHFQLFPRWSEEFYLRVSVPQDTPGEVYRARVVATSQSHSEVQSQVILEIEVQATSLDAMLWAGEGQAAEPLVAGGVIELELETRQMSLLVGESVEQQIRLRNVSAPPGNFDLGLQGIPSGWYSFSCATVNLFPNWQEEVYLRVALPADAVALVYAAQVVAVAVGHPEIRAEVGLEIQAQGIKPTIVEPLPGAVRAPDPDGLTVKQIPIMLPPVEPIQVTPLVAPAPTYPDQALPPVAPPYAPQPGWQPQPVAEPPRKQRWFQRRKDNKPSAPAPGYNGQPPYYYPPDPNQAYPQNYAPPPGQAYPPAPNQGYPPQSYAPAPIQGYAPQSYPPAPEQGYPQQNYAPAPIQGYPPQNYAPAPNQGYPPQNYAPAPEQSYTPAPAQAYAPVPEQVPSSDPSQARLTLDELFQPAAQATPISFGAAPDSQPTNRPSGSAITTPPTRPPGATPGYGSTKIGIALDAPRMTLVAGGEKATQTINLTNLTSLPDNFDISIEGIPSSWFNLSTTELNLFPNWSGTVTIEIEVSEKVPPNLYSGRVIVASRNQAGLRSEAGLEVEVVAPLRLQARLQPRRAKAFKAHYNLILRNRSMSEAILPLRLSPSNPYCVGQFSPAEARIAGRQSVTVKLKVQLAPKTPQEQALQLQNFEILVQPKWIVAQRQVMTPDVLIEGEYNSESRWAVIWRHPWLFATATLLLLIVIFWSLLILPAIQNGIFLLADRVAYTNTGPLPKSLRVEQNDFTDTIQNKINALPSVFKVEVRFYEDLPVAGKPDEKQLVVIKLTSFFVTAEMRGHLQVTPDTGELIFKSEPNPKQSESFPWFFASPEKFVKDKITKKLKGWLAPQNQRLDKAEIEGNTLYLRLKPCGTNDLGCQIEVNKK